MSCRLACKRYELYLATLKQILVSSYYVCTNAHAKTYTFVRSHYLGLRCSKFVSRNFAFVGAREFEDKKKRKRKGDKNLIPHTMHSILYCTQFKNQSEYYRHYFPQNMPSCHFTSNTAMRFFNTSLKFFRSKRERLKLKIIYIFQPAF